MSHRSFDEAVRLLHARTNLESLQTFSPQDMEGRFEPLRNILTSLGNPERTYRTVHIAGTKGKGSTCVMLEAILREEGYHVGRFTSPHMYSFTERLMIDGIPCPPHEFTELFFSVCGQIEPDILQSFTYFELLTLLAFVYFSQQKVDVALFEVGLGGRLDATNLCCPDVSVITSISYDHMAQLGSTLTSIAAEKSGIIKSSVPVVTTVRHPEPQQVIRNRAKSLGSPLFVLNEHFLVHYDSSSASFRYVKNEKVTLDHLSLAMPGAHQIENAAAAITAFLLLHREKKPLDTDKIRVGLQKAFIPLRIEFVRRNEESPTLIFDGAHNRASMRALMETVEEMFPNRRLLLIFGASLEKDVEGMFAEIGERFEHVFLTQASDSSRRFRPRDLRSMLHLPDARVTVLEDGKEALEQCLQMAASKDVVCVTGSLYLAAELRQYIL